jgi:hypothetical protein
MMIPPQNKKNRTKNNRSAKYPIYWEIGEGASGCMGRREKGGEKITAQAHSSRRVCREEGKCGRKAHPSATE